MGLDLVVVLLEIETMVVTGNFNVIFIVDVCEDGPVSIVMDSSAIRIVLVAASCLEYGALFFRKEPCVFSIPDHFCVILNSFCIIRKILIINMVCLNRRQMRKSLFDLVSQIL